MAHAICQNFEFKTTLCIIFHPSFFVSKRGRLVGMKSLWLISILFFTAFSEGLKRRPKGISRRNFGPKSKSLYSRIKNDLDGVENRIQLELKAISLKIDLKADSEDRPRPDENSGTIGQYALSTDTSKMSTRWVNGLTALTNAISVSASARDLQEYINNIQLSLNRSHGCSSVPVTHKSCPQGRGSLWN